VTATDTDNDNDHLTYAFMDSTGNGYFDVNGTVEPANQVFYVDQNQLANVHYHAGPSGTADHIFANVFDGTVWAPGTQLDVTVPSASQPPTITSSNVTATAAQMLQASALVTATDTDNDNDTLTYAFMDATGNGYFDVNGQVEPANTVFYVGQSQLATVHYHAGPSGTSDQIFANVFDGTLWASGTQFDVTVPAANQPPTITSSNVSASHAQAFQASSLVTATDTDNDNDHLTYAFMDATGNGYFDVNGTVEPANTVFYVDQNQLANVHYHAGPGGTSDHIFANVFDGTVWATGTQFNVTVPTGSQSLVTTASHMSVTDGQSPAETLADPLVNRPPQDLPVSPSNWTLAGSSAEFPFNLPAGAGLVMTAPVGDQIYLAQPLTDHFGQWLV
jgi:hypothetical protein